MSGSSRTTKAKASGRRSVDAVVEFFDSHDLGDVWDQLPQAQFSVDIKRRKRLVALDEDIVERLDHAASAKKVSAETLLSSWIREKLAV